MQNDQFKSKKTIDKEGSRAEFKAYRSIFSCKLIKLNIVL